MPVFIERFLLPLLVSIVVLFTISNVFKLDWHQRVSFALAVLFLAYFISHTVHKKAKADPRLPELTSVPPESRQQQSSAVGTATTHPQSTQSTSGNMSPLIHGSGNKVVINPPDRKTETPMVAILEIALLGEVQEGAAILVQVVFSNTGKAIARSVHQQTSVVSTDLPKFDPAFSDLRARLSGKNASDLPPGVSKSMKTPIPIFTGTDGRAHTGPLDIGSARDIVQGRRRIGVAGVFRYSDDNGHSFETTYCAVYNPLKHPFFDECAEGNRSHVSIP